MYLADTAHYRNRERFEDQLYLFGLLVTTGATKRVLLATEVVGDMLTNEVSTGGESTFALAT
jgi:hypothetical protein